MNPGRFPWRTHTSFSGTACFPSIPSEFLSVGPTIHTRNFNHNTSHPHIPLLCGVRRVVSFPVVGIQPLLSLHWHYPLYLAAFMAVHKSSILPAFSNFSPQPGVFATGISHSLLPTLICECGFRLFSVFSKR